MSSAPADSASVLSGINWVSLGAEKMWLGAGEDVSILCVVSVPGWSAKLLNTAGHDRGMSAKTFGAFLLLFL